MEKTLEEPRIWKELGKKSIGPKMFGDFLGVSEKTAWNKLHGVTEFTVSEAVKTKRELFPEYDIEWLFGRENCESNAKPKS